MIVVKANLQLATLSLDGRDGLKAGENSIVGVGHSR
jgi:hypothetical protein